MVNGAQVWDEYVLSLFQHHICDVVGHGGLERFQSVYCPGDLSVCYVLEACYWFWIEYLLWGWRLAGWWGEEALVQYPTLVFVVGCLALLAVGVGLECRDSGSPAVCGGVSYQFV